MRRRKGSRRTLTHLLRTLHQIIEETMLIARPRQQLLIVIEVVADGGKDTVQKKEEMMTKDTFSSRSKRRMKYHSTMTSIMG